MVRKGQDELLQQVLERKAACAIPDDVDLWPHIRAEVKRRRLRRLGKGAALVTFPAVMGVLIAVALLAGGWGNGAPSAQAAYVARAVDALFKVKSVYVVQESQSNRMAGAYLLDDMPRGQYPTLDQYDLKDCRDVSGVEECTIVDKATGNRWGTARSSGGKRRKEGYYVFPDKFYSRTTQELDQPLAPENIRVRGALPGRKVSVWEWLYVEGRAYTRRDWIMGNAWTDPPQGSRLGQGLSPAELFWGLFQGGDGQPGAPELLRRRFDTVELLEETDIDGAATRRYRVTLDGSDRAQVLDIWIGVKDGLPRKVVSETVGGVQHAGFQLASGWRDTYVFSRFNEPLEIPPEPAADEVKQLPAPPPRP